MGPWLAVAPMLCLLLGALSLMMVDAFAEQRPELGVLSTTVLLGAAALAMALWGSSQGSVVPAQLGHYLAADRFALFFDVVICGSAALSAMLAGGYLREHRIERGEFYPLLVLSSLGAMVLARSTDLLSAFLGLETMSVGVYALVAFRRTSPRAAEASMKYLLLGSFAAAVLLFGVALLYGATGHTDFAGIARAIAVGADVRLLIVGAILVTFGLAFKIAAVPLHMWMPDAYEGATTPVTAFMAAVVKAAVFAVMLRVYLVSLSDPDLASGSSGWPPLLAGLSAATMIVGNLGAITQKSVKRMLGYSSIAHAGYILIGLVAAARLGQEAVSSVLFYVAAYAVSSALTFGSLVWVGSYRREAVSYEDLAGVGRRHPAVAVPFAIGVLSLMGFPLTAGFFAKYFVFAAAVEVGGGMVWLAALGALTSVVGAYYYLRVLVFMFMKVPEEGAEQAIPMRSGYVTGAVVGAAVVALQMGVVPSGYLEWARDAAALLLA